MHKIFLFDQRLETVETAGRIPATLSNIMGGKNLWDETFSNIDEEPIDDDGSFEDWEEDSAIQEGEADYYIHDFDNNFGKRIGRIN
jgi:hypothetical protein